MSVERTIDAKGRITIPQELRDRLGLDPGTDVFLEIGDGEVIVRPAIDRAEAIASLRGCIDEHSRRPDAKPIDPLDLKDEWTADLQ